MTIQLYRTPQREDLDEPLVVSTNGNILTVAGVEYDLSDITEAPEVLEIPHVVGPIFRRDGKIHVLVIAPYGADETPVGADPMPQPLPQPQPFAGVPELFASAGFAVSGGVLGTIEMAAQLQSAYYEDGWMFAAFAHPQDDMNYLVFVQTDVPAKIEQFKDLGSFELVFSDPSTGDPIEPGRIDLQILKVR